MLQSKSNKILIEFSQSFKDSSKIYKKIKYIISKNTPSFISSGNVINSGISSELDELRTIMHSGKKWIDSFQNSLKEELKIPKLKIGYNKIFGYYIEVTKSHQAKIPSSFVRKQTLTNSERYITEELKKYEEKVLNAEENIFLVESKIFMNYVKKF